MKNKIWIKRKFKRFELDDPRTFGVDIYIIYNNYKIRARKIIPEEEISRKHVAIIYEIVGNYYPDLKIYEIPDINREICDLFEYHKVEISKFAAKRLEDFIKNNKY